MVDFKLGDGGGALRIIIALAAASLLGGCNMVMSETPWFSDADQAGAPPIREGVWVASNDGKCAFNKDDPVDKWPKCADGSVLKDGQMRSVPAREGAPDVMSYIVAAGDPAIWQLHLPSDSKTPPPIPMPQYMYIAVVPTATDATGKVVAIREWPVMCGPPPPKEPDAAKDKDAGAKDADDKGADAMLDLMRPSKAPFPGLTMTQIGCVAASKDAVRNAAKLSEGLSPQIQQRMRWVRDGDK